MCLYFLFQPDPFYKMEGKSFPLRSRKQSQNGPPTPVEPLSFDTQGSEELMPDSWDCSVCTYKNKPEAFKCSICDTRKGTSTRKARVNTSTFVAQQMASQLQMTPLAKYQKLNAAHHRRVQKKGVVRHGRLKNIDRSSGEDTEVTVNGITVTVTDYKPLKRRSSPSPPRESDEEVEE